ncbi:4'-phosphopantetheinyl transferase superfamily protein [Kineosporia sp. J2-2]|uniref:4'-phosphopantetheinyl transferase superfamily protein n=1 Tax=Kineosporia corallincola TaxID=2835133 RepID=A0ABS5TAY2_9ACTN|nr:4'-phosphopantetheinyl transferase superfamily protein [Kineosporia corallincola]MBT0767293.1 4'-phosphopantetheinyl transferase superfamily protein [Kineosporia corallincola]
MPEARTPQERPLTAVPPPGSHPAPSGAALEIWWSRVDVGNLTDDVRDGLAASLDERRLAKIARYRRAEDRDRGLAAHALLRRLLAAVTGTPPNRIELGAFCISCGEYGHGKPFLDTGDDERPVEINLSHSGEVVIVALAAPGVQLGVDAEQTRTVDWNALRSSIFADQEWAATERRADQEHRRLVTWARKESSVKASGHGLSLPLRDVVTADGAGGSWSATMPAGVGRAAGTDLELAPDVAAAVAVLRDEGWPEPPVVNRVGIGSAPGSGSASGAGLGIG